MATKTPHLPALHLSVAILLGVSASVFSDARAESAGEAERHFEKANELLKREDYDGAIAEYRKVVSLSPDGEIAQDAQYWVGQSHFRAGRFDAAQATFAKLIEQYPASAIIPVTKLLVDRVEQAKKDEETRRAMGAAEDKGFIIDPDTGVKYTRIERFSGKNDVIVDTTESNRLGFTPLSPNGKFLLYGKLVVPVDGSEPFDLVDMPATRCNWSPDGSNVVFYTGGAICMVPVSPQTARPTAPVRKLLDGRYRWGPKASWSPDGEKLAFGRTGNRRHGIGGGDIWTLSVKDGSLTQITDDPAGEFGPKWSPDGKSIVYAMRRNRLSFWLVSAEGGTPRKIIEPEGRCIPFWSPDSKWILYTVEGRIHLYRPDDNKELEIVPPNEVVGDFFSWSPDGKKMLFYRPSYGYEYGLKVVSAFGGPPFDLGRHVTLYPEHVWSPDDRMIVAEGGSEDGRYGLWVSPLSGGVPALLTMDVSVRGSPSPISVSPDAKKLVFDVKRDDGTDDLFVVPISLQEARTTGPAIKIFEGLWRGSGANVTTSWSPDGSKLAVIHRWDVWIAFSNGDQPVQITKTPERELWPKWSPDSRTVSYVAGSERSFYVRPVSGREATRIPGADRTSAWSPDSKSLVIQSEGVISVVSVASGETQQIAAMKDLGLERVFCFSWSPDGRHIACVGEHIEKGDAGPVFIIPVEGGEVTTLATGDTSCKYLLHWSHDGKWISYSSEGPAKVRPAGTMWEAGFEQIVSKASAAAK
jgi:Tol biopolymer transport system component